ncbi:MAG: YicC family protein [Clostridia bacterium]|nr:YicC family protein [Clostridia bacterium]
MFKSMTGYGRSKLELGDKEYTIEIKSVNHRYLDLSMKLPRNISYLEEKIKKVVSNNINRGKIDVCITYSNILTETESNVCINKVLAKEYITQLKEIAKDNNLSEDFDVTSILRLPDLLVTNNDIDEEEIWKIFEPKVNEAVKALDAMRVEEGIQLSKDVLDRIDTIAKNLDIISENSTGLAEKYVVKLEARIKEILKTDVVDQNRLAQEIVIYSDKCSIEEEITRMHSHIEQFKELVNDTESKGKKIDFLIQEMNRETNTIASKANCLDITKMVIEIKTELENIREQIQNIE